jgi:hypothetical protein
MIEYRIRSDGMGGLFCPAFVCDFCYSQIIQEGNVVWGVRDDTHTGDHVAYLTPIYATHKGCHGVFEKTFTERFRGENWLIMAEEITTFVRQLRNNATMSLDKPGTRFQETAIALPRW